MILRQERINTMKIIITKELFEARKEQFARLLIGCEASLYEVNAVLNAEIKEISTDLIKIRIDDNDIVIIINDEMESEILEVIIDNAPLVLASAKALMMLLKAFDKKLKGIYEKHVGHFYDQLKQQFGSKDE